jgi:IS1 family transposase
VDFPAREIGVRDAVKHWEIEHVGNPPYIPEVVLGRMIEKIHVSDYSNDVNERFFPANVANVVSSKSGGDRDNRSRFFTRHYGLGDLERPRIRIRWEVLPLMQASCAFGEHIVGVCQTFICHNYLNRWENGQRFKFRRFLNDIDSQSCCFFGKCRFKLLPHQGELPRHVFTLLSHNTSLKVGRGNLVGHLHPLISHLAQCCEGDANTADSDNNEGYSAKNPYYADNTFDKVNRLFWGGRDNLNIFIAVALYPFGMSIGIAGCTCSAGLRRILFCCGVGLCCIGGFVISLPAWGGWLLKTTKNNPCGNYQYGSFHGRQIVPRKPLTGNVYWGTVIPVANVLNIDKQIAIIGALTEGSSIRSIERVTGVHRDTIMRLGVKVGQGCARILDSSMRNLPCNRLEMAEIWGFVGKKDRNVRIGEEGVGSVWTFCAIDAETKLVPAFKVGNRDTATAKAFVQDVADRMAYRVQISTDGLSAYVAAMQSAFGEFVDMGRSSGLTGMKKAPLSLFRPRKRWLSESRMSG